MVTPTTSRFDVAAWGEAPDISARSVLVTIFGDTVLPVTDEFWLAQLFRLTEAFGFSQRLIRTSMFRLASEGWLTNERVGRQSRYTLTALAIAETAQASSRIYRNAVPDWTGQWTLVLINGTDADAQQRRDLIQHLQWQGFVNLGSGALASPTARPDDVRAGMALLPRPVSTAVATATFEDLDRLVADGFFDQALDLPAFEQAYRAFIDRYEPVAKSNRTTEPLAAFAMRTALIHDLRRIRLRFPDLPGPILASNPLADTAHQLAAGLYRQLSERCAPALAEVLEVDYPPLPPGRFDDV